MRAPIFLAIFLAAAPTGGVTVSSGLRGVVTRGPISPVCAAEQPCTAPAKHVTLLFSRGGYVVGRSTTDELGRYRVRLPAGLYRVRRTVSTAVGRGLEPDQARVQRGRLTRIDFSIDTGIR